MAGNDVAFGREARMAMLSGLSLAARAAGTAMGPMGRYVLSERDYGPPMLRDGVGIVRLIELADRRQQIGVEMARSVAVECADRVGDGTCAAVLMFHRLVAEGAKAMDAQLDPGDFLLGVRAATAAALSHIETLTRRDIDAAVMAQIATIAANADADTGTIVAEAIAAAGDEGLMTVRVGNATTTTMSTTPGYSFETKLLSDHLAVAANNGVRELEDAFVLIVAGGIQSFEAITPLLEAILEDNQPLVIVAETIAAPALAGLIENKRSAIIDSAAIGSTLSGERRGDLLADLALFTGATVVGTPAGPGLEQAGRDVLGTAARVVFAKSETRFIAGAGDAAAVATAARNLGAAAERSPPGYDKNHLQKRRAQLTGTSVVIDIGGASELEAKERRDRTDNAARAVKAALRGGYVAGGGLAFLAAAGALAAVRNGNVDHDAGVAALGKALQAPALRIFDNAGLEGRPLVERFADCYPRGLDLRSGEEADLIAAGVIDAAEVIRFALESAVSAAEVLIRTEAVIIKNQERTR